MDEAYTTEKLLNPRWMHTLSLLAEHLIAAGYEFPRFAAHAPTDEAYDALPSEERTRHVLDTKMCDPDTPGARLHRHKELRIDEIDVVIYPPVRVTA